MFIEPLEMRTLLSAGELDPSFGDGGEVTVDFTPGQDVLRRIAFTPGGKLLLAGRSGDNVALARLNTNGLLDAPFGNGGKLITSLPHALGDTIAIDPVEGKIAMARTFAEGSVPVAIDVVVLRADGSPDATFSGDGRATIDIAASGLHLAWVRGQLIIAGNRDTAVGGDTEIVVTRLTTSGAIDTSFGDNGTRAISKNVVTTDQSTDTRTVVRLLVDESGQILIGSQYTRVTLDQVFGDFEFFGGNVFRLTDDGDLDHSFGDGDGDALVFFAESADPETLSDVLLDPVGGGITTIRGRDIDDSYVIVRFDANGSADDVADASFKLPERNVAQFGVDDAGRVLVTGVFNRDETGVQQDVFVTRILPDGLLDRSYGRRGEARVTFFSRTDPSQLGRTPALFEPDGRVVVGGTRAVGAAGNEAFAVVRLQGGEGAPAEMHLTRKRALRVITNNTSETIRVHRRRSDGRIVVRVGDHARSFAPSRVKRVVINAMGGDDSITFVPAPSGLPRGFVMGGLGDDSITGTSGNDVLQGDEGDDTISAGAGIDEIFGAGGEDDLFGDAGADTISGENNADRLHGGDGDDLLFGGPGPYADHLDGGAGHDSADGADDPLDSLNEIEVLL